MFVSFYLKIITALFGGFEKNAYLCIQFFLPTKIDNVKII